MFGDSLGSNPSTASSKTPNKDWVAEDSNVSAAQSSSPVKKEEQEEDIGKYMLSEVEEDDYEQLLCVMMYGKDGTAKSGIMLDYLNDQDLKDGKRAVVIDLDGGNIPLLIKHHKERCHKAGRKLKDAYIVKNPLFEAEDGSFDYAKTFERINKIIKWVKANHKEYNIKFLTFDGLSTALKHAEQQMRLDKHLAADGGVQLRYWLVRNKMFIETLEHIKALPISKFFIAHEDFVLKTGEENSAVKEKTNAMMHQKIRCDRVKTPTGIKFQATIDKNKYSTAVEGKIYTICEVDNDQDTYKWNSDKLFKELV